MWGKSTAISRLRQTDFSHQFSVTRIGAQGIEREVGPEAIQQVAVFLVCGVEPLEGMFFVAQIGIQTRYSVSRNVTSLGFALCE